MSDDTTPDEPSQTTESAQADSKRRRPRPKKSARSSRTTKLLIGVTLLGGLVFVASVAAVAWVVTTQDAGDVKEASTLKVKLKGQLTEAPQQGLLLDPEKIPPMVTEVSQAIRAAAEDERITGLYLDLDSPSAGMASFQEIRGAVDVFTDAGKPCVAYSEAYTNSTYYLASGCDHVVLAPAGVFAVLGMNAEITYYAETFEKIGVKSEMLHVGDFKSAIEPYERKGPSESASEAYNYFLDGLYGDLIAGIAAGRGWDEAEARSLIDRPPLSPSDALERGAVDAIGFRDGIETNIDQLGEEGFVELIGAEPTEVPEDVDDKFTPLNEYLKAQRYRNSGFDHQIAVVHAEGPIVSGDDGGGLFGGSALADRPFQRWMEEARDDESVKAVVLRVDSPGGSGLASDMMWREVKLTQAAGKPVVVSMSDYAASGGYFISAPADWIVAQPSTLTGSIGVFGGKFNLDGTYEKLALHTHAYQRGSNADLFSVTQGFSESGRAIMQGYLDGFYDVFVRKVTEGRDMTWDEVHEVAQGRVWTGSQAMERGLVDELGGLEIALSKAAELSDLDEYGIKRLPRQKSFVEILLEDMGASAFHPTVEVELPGVLAVEDQAWRDLLVLERVLSDGGVAAMLPFRLQLR